VASTVAPSSRASSIECSKAARTPGSMPSPESSSGTPKRRPSSDVAVGVFTGSGNPVEVESHGSLDVMAPNRSAASRTSRVKGPAWSSDDANAIIPYRETAP
jgi:hypothetical protein